MDYREKSLGRNVRFLLPSLKLMQPGKDGSTAAHAVHRFLVEHFGGYTATSANLFGYWKDDSGGNSYGEHREFTVALTDETKLPELKAFLGRTARELDEECLYVEVAGEVILIYGSQGAGRRLRDCLGPADVGNARNAERMQLRVVRDEVIHSSRRC